MVAVAEMVETITMVTVAETVETVEAGIVERKTTTEITKHANVSRSSGTRHIPLVDIFWRLRITERDPKRAIGS
ncbi:hypothetical protein, partial [Halocatena pleomorpha]|uniref:hypothetical protein n=1 Tax=Halocatena pleomorpha TaxID=1785090 RepID=UPI001C8971FE